MERRAEGGQGSLLDEPAGGDAPSITYALLTAAVTGRDRAAILDELEFRQGEPLGDSAMVNSRTKLTRLGLFRRVDIEPVEHPGEATRDVRITVQESDRTTLGYGGGVEGTVRARRTGPGGTAEDHIELAPRGEFEIGRRNLWGSNRSVNLFTRVSLRSTDVFRNTTETEAAESNRGFNEFRVIGTFREPRLFFSNRSELLITGIVEQAVRTTFNFARRIVRAEVRTQRTPTVSLTGRYSFEKTRLFDEAFQADETLLIDKLFPQVRLSKLAGSLILGAAGFGNSAGPLPVEAFVKAFITEPTTDVPDYGIFLEVIDITRPGDKDAVVHDIVQLYR